MITATRTDLERGHQLIVWDGLGMGSEGDWVTLSTLPEMTVTIEGGLVRLMGKNLKEGEAFEMVDAQGMPMQHPGIYRVRLNPLYFRPEVIAGDRIRVTALGTRGG